MSEVIKHYSTQYNTVTIVGTQYEANFRYVNALVETAKEDFPQLKEESIYICIMADHPLYHDHVGINFRVGPAWGVNDDYEVSRELLSYFK